MMEADQHDADTGLEDIMYHKIPFLPASQPSSPAGFRPSDEEPATQKSCRWGGLNLVPGGGGLTAGNPRAEYRCPFGCVPCHAGS